MDRAQLTQRCLPKAVRQSITWWPLETRCGAGLLGNPYYWPRLWSINDYITNPLDLPGNRIVFRMGSLIEPPSVELETSRDGFSVVAWISDVEVECGPDRRFDTILSADKYTAPAFLRKRKNLEIFGSIAKAKPQQICLRKTTWCTCGWRRSDAYECGDILSVYRPVKRKIRHPKIRRQKYGSLFRILGELRIVHKYGDHLSATVRESYMEMHRGDLVGPAMPVTVELEVGKPRGDLEGQIVARMSQERVWPPLVRRCSLIEVGRTVFVSEIVFMWSHASTKCWTQSVRIRLPPSVIGRLVIVQVDDYSSTAVITDANRSIPVGSEIITRISGQLPTENWALRTTRCAWSCLSHLRQKMTTISGFWHGAARLSGRIDWSTIVRENNQSISNVSTASDQIRGPKTIHRKTSENRAIGLMVMPSSSTIKLSTALRNLPYAPPVLFYAGNIGLLAEPCVSIVGARKCSQAGKQLARTMATILVQAGFVVVSGMAYGIDTAAHSASEGQTIAVLGQAWTMPTKPSVQNHVRL